MSVIKVTLSIFVLLNTMSFISAQYYATDDELRTLRNRRKRPNNNSGGPCGRQNLNNRENPKFLGLAYINVESTYNCGTDGHYTNTYGGTGGQNGGLFGGGGNHKPHRPHRPFQNHGNNQNHNDEQDGGQSDVGGTGNGGGGGLFGNKPNRPFAGLVNSISSGLSSGYGNGGAYDVGEGPGAAFGGLVSSVVSNVGTFVSNNNPFQGGTNPFQSSSNSYSPPQTTVEDVPNDPAPVFEQDKLPFFSNHLFQKPHHENTQNNQNQGLFFGLFDGSIINSYLNQKPGQNNNNYRPTTQRPQYGINSNFVATQTSQRPPITEEIHEDYDLITEAYSLHKPVMAQKPPVHANPYANLRPGQYLNAYNPINGMYDINRVDNIDPNKVIKQINKGFNQLLDLLL